MPNGADTHLPRSECLVLAHMRGLMPGLGQLGGVVLRRVAPGTKGMMGIVDTYLETERLILRRFTADDADLLIELDSDPAVMRYHAGGEPTAPEVVRERDLPDVLAGYEKWDGNFGLFAAQEK